MKEEHLRLFTPVSEGLPEKSGSANFVLCIVDNKYLTVGHITSSSENNIWLDESYDFIPNVTHWLDLSKLTTKAKAEELAREAYGKGLNDTPLEFKNGKSNEDNIDDFITQNITKL